MLSKKSNRFLSLITLISICAITIGVTALTVVLSVMEGFEYELKNKMLGLYPPIVLMKYGSEGISGYDDISKKIATIAGIKNVTPIIFKEGMIIADTGQTAGVFVNGVPVTNGKAGLKIEKNIIRGPFNPHGDFSVLEARQDVDSNGIVLSDGLARDLLVSPGDSISMLAPFGEITPFGNQPKIKRFTVVGLFKASTYDFNSKFAFIELSVAQRFFNIGAAVNQIEVDVHNIDDTTRITHEMNQQLSVPFYTEDWKSRSSNLLDAMKLEKTVMFIILSMIIMVAAFNIVAMLIMIVMEKSKDIAILRSMGSSGRSIMKIFIIKGTVIGVLGTLLGSLFGIALGYLLKYHIRFPLNPQVYYIEMLPVKMYWYDFALVITASLLISFLATLYPAYKASKINPVDGLRYE